MFRNLTKAIVFIMIFNLLSGCNSSKDNLPVTQTRTDLLGTVITLSIYGKAEGDVFKDVFSCIEEIEEKMSLKKADSEINKIAKMAGESATEVSGDTFFVIENAKKISMLSEGSFDLSIGALVKLWGIGTDNERVPAKEEIEAAKSFVDYKKVELNQKDKTVFLHKSGMLIDLGAIAKGYAGDRVKEVLKKKGINNAMADLGGNIVAVGKKPDGNLWRVAVKNPILGESGNIGVVSVSDKAVVTSGGYERFFIDNDNFYHHIIDPKTGYPAESEFLSVTVVADESIVADMLSTPLFMLSLEQSKKLLEEFLAEAIFVTKENKIYVTDGLCDSFSITDQRFQYAEK